MLDISYDPKTINVIIDGKEYKVADRTDETNAELEAHDAKLESMSQYEANYSIVEILLGKDAAKKVFPGGKKENLTRMYVIAKRLLEAYQAEYEEIKEAEYEEAMSRMDKMAERSKPVIEIIDKANAQKKTGNIRKR